MLFRFCAYKSRAELFKKYQLKQQQRSFILPLSISYYLKSMYINIKSGFINSINSIFFVTFLTILSLSVITRNKRHKVLFWNNKILEFLKFLNFQPLFEGSGY